jgi:DNA-binding CsgD family transcriptional regulator
MRRLRLLKPCPAGGSLLPIIEAGYRPERSEADWLQGVADALHPVFDVGCGVTLTAAARPYGDDELPVVDPRCTPGAEGFLARLPELISTLGAKTIRICEEERSNGLSCTEISEWSGTRLDDVVESIYRPVGIRSSFGFTARFADQRELVFVVPLPWRARTDVKSRQTWQQLFAHLVEGWRLRRVLERPQGDGVGAMEAVLDPGGKVLHAEGAAREHLDALRSAVVGIDRARSGWSLDPLSGLAWPGPVDDRWSLIDQFDRDGRRFVIARRVRREPSPVAELSPRERQVMEALTNGRSNKAIAFDLDISVSTVAQAISRAKRKLGAHSRVELIRSAG